MRLLQFTINVAVPDESDISADAVREVAHRAVSDGTGADVCFTSDAHEWTDPTPDDDDDWNDRAHEALDDPPVVSDDPETNWKNDAIQFPRLIAEMEALGLLAGAQLTPIIESMDLTRAQLGEIVDRAQKTWDAIKAQTGGAE